MNNQFNLSLKIFFVVALLCNSNVVLSMSMAYRYPYRLYSFKVDSDRHLEKSLFKGVIHKNHRMVESILSDSKTKTKSFSYYSREGTTTIDLYDIARYNKDKCMISVLKKYGIKEVSDQKASPLVIAAFCDYGNDVKIHLNEVVRRNAKEAFINGLRVSYSEKTPVNLSKNKAVLALENIKKQHVESDNIKEALAISVGKKSLTSLSVLLSDTVIQKFLSEDSHQTKGFNCRLLDIASWHDDTVALELLLKSPCVSGLKHVENICRRPHTRLDAALESNDTQKIMLIKQYGGLTGKEYQRRRETAKKETTNILFNIVKNKKANAVEAVLKSDNMRDIFYEFPQCHLKIDLYSIAEYNKDEEMIRILTKYGCKKSSDQEISSLVIAAFCDDSHQVESLSVSSTEKDLETAIAVAHARASDKSLAILKKKYPHC